jgi:hypothetical protein
VETVHSIMLCVHHPQSDTTDLSKYPAIRPYIEKFADSDGHFIRWEASEMPEFFVMRTEFNRGMDAKSVAAILRKLATLVENNSKLVNQNAPASGDFEQGRAKRLDGDHSGDL